MWKAPNRPKYEITQAFNDGIVKIYSVQDEAKPGYKPVQKLSEKITLRFEEQRLGITRLYQSRQAQNEIEKVIRVPKAGNISVKDVAVLEGKQYTIDTIQKVPDVYPPCQDLALVRIEQEIEVMV